MNISLMVKRSTTQPAYTVVLYNVFFSLEDFVFCQCSGKIPFIFNKAVVNISKQGRPFHWYLQNNMILVDLHCKRKTSLKLVQIWRLKSG